VKAQGTSHCPNSDEVEPGFTILELVVVVAVVALLGLMILPGLARTRADSRGFQCLNNNRELNRAWRMSTDENNDLLLFSAVGASSGSPNPRVWIASELDFTSAPKNWDPTASIVQSPMWRYCGRNVNLWRCPSDESYVVVNGVARPRVRSYSMNLYLGGYGGALGSPFSAYQLYLKSSEILTPPPDRLFVFLDVRPESITWGNFDVQMEGYSPSNPAAYRFDGDLPGYYHDGAATFSYADGHGEIHRWQDPRTTPPPSPSYPPNALLPLVSPRNADIAWLQDRATRPK